MTGGETDGRTLHDLDSFRSACDRLLTDTRRSVRIVAPYLDLSLLNREPVSTALANLTRISPNTSIRLLFCDSMLAMKHGHRLIELARRFPSFIHLRLLPGDQQGVRDAWMLCDDKNLLWRPDHHRYDNGMVQTPSLELGQKLMRDFDSWWERAHPDPEMRRLFI